MPVAAHAITKLTTRSTRTNTAYGDLASGALQIASGAFTVGETYLLVIMGALDGSGTNNNHGCRVVHGSTAFADSEKVFEPATATNRVQYFWFHEWVAVSGEAITVQFKASAGSIGADKFVLHAFKKGGADGITYQYDELAGAPDDLSATFLDGASVTFNATASEKWALAFYAQHDPAAATIEHDIRGDLSGATALTIGLNREEPEDVAFPDIVTGGFISGHELAEGSHTWKEQSAEEVDSAGTRLFSKVVAIPLSQFKDASVVFDQTNVDLGTTSFGNLVSTLTHTPTVSGAHDVIVIASTRNDHTVAGAGTGSHHRLQTDNADTPADQSSVNGGVGWDYRGPLNDGQDNDPWIMSDKVNISAAITVDSDADGTTTTMDLKDRSIIVFSLELASVALAAAPVRPIVMLGPRAVAFAAAMPFLRPQPPGVPPAGAQLFEVLLAGVTGPAGAIIKDVARVLTGTTSPSGALLKEVLRVLTGTTSPSGTLAQQVNTFLAGSASPSGAVALIRLAVVALAGVTSPTGVLLREVRQILTGTIGPVGTLLKQVQKLFSGTTSPSSVTAAVRAAILAVAGATSPAGSIVQQVQILRTGATSPVGTLLKMMQRLLTGATSPSAVLAIVRAAILAIAGATSPAGTYRIVAQIVRAGSATPVGSLAREVRRVLTGAITPIGTFAKTLGRVFGGVLNSLGGLAMLLLPKPPKLPAMLTIQPVPYLRDARIVNQLAVQRAPYLEARYSS